MIYIFRKIVRPALCLLLAANLLVAAAQVPDDSKDALSAAAMKEFKDATALAGKTDHESLEAAIEKLNKAIELFTKAGNGAGRAGPLILRGTCYERLGRYSEAMADQQAALALYEAANLLNAQALALNFIGGLYLRQNDAEKARTALERAWELIQKEPFQSVDLMILNNLGNAYIVLEERKKATDTLWKAAQLAKDRKPEEMVGALKNYADGQVQLESPKVAVFYYETALKRARAAKLQTLEVILLNSLSGLYLNHLDEPEKAKVFLDQALPKLDAVNDDGLKSIVLYNLGYYNYLSIRMQDALVYFESSNVLALKIKNRPYEANIANGVGLIHAFFDDHRKALPYFERAIDIARETNNKSLETLALVNHAKSLEPTGDSKTAIADFLRATDLVKGGFPGVKRVAISVLFDFGSFAFRSGNSKQAFEIYSQALPKAQELGNRPIEAAILNNIAKIHEVNGDLVKAREMYNSSLAISRSLGIRYSEAKSLENLMSVWSKLGNRNFAAFYGKNAVNIYQEFRKGMTGLSAEEQKSFMKNVEISYRKLAAVLIEQGRIAEAEQVLVMLKQEELIEYVRRDDRVASDLLATMALTDDERAALARYQTTAEHLTSLGKEFSELESERKAFAPGEFPKQKRYDELKQQLADASTAFEKFLEELKVKFGQQDVRVAQVDSSLKKTLDRLKAKHTAAVSTIVGEETLNIIVTTSKTQRAHTIKKSAKEINDLVAKFRTALTSPKYDPRPTSQMLYDLIVKPIEGDLAGIKADTILWSLDGTLRYIPPTALWDKKNGYLAERFANVMVNLASRDTLALPVRNGQQLSVLGVGVSKPADGFSALIAVPDELDCIVSDKAAGILSATPQCKNGVLAGRKLLDEKFTLTSFEDEIGRYPIIHIASHFKLTPGDDKNSFLLLGGGANRKFTVEKLRNQPLTDVELIVLSACNTATPGGAKTNGVEVEGFGAIAQEEGAKSVLATLWSVADTSTKDFMVEFYNIYGKNGASKADAMRRAQMKLMNGKYSAGEATDKRRAELFVQGVDKTLPVFKTDPNAPFAHPYYWSPFILIGNWL